MKVTKAIFPVAGLGTRFLPATKANPKEMMPIVDKPLIQYAVEEAVAAGITELIFVTSSSKRAIEDHFDSNYELESNLLARGKFEMLSVVRGILPEHVSCVYVRQKFPQGLGHAVLCARQLVMNEPFAVILADDLIDTGEEKSCLSQMLHAYEEVQASIIAVQKIPQLESRKYGVVDDITPDVPLTAIRGIIEKPHPYRAPSDLGVVGRYILSPRIFSYLENLKEGLGNEIQLTDAIAGLVKEETVYAFKFQGTRYDCGDKLGYLRATIAYALKHPELCHSFRYFLEELKESQI
ncbi:MAG TPA: UTP--glucose-1-phosphate uridylyltransferase GalU [Gammaproteobacteria bacterium]|nr:UTP--glucose-1-phosphate uridylyltransferase GalU [Gammaproteobacteria bacterium]